MGHDDADAGSRQVHPAVSPDFSLPNQIVQGVADHDDDVDPFAAFQPGGHRLRRIAHARSPLVTSLSPVSRSKTGARVLQAAAKPPELTTCSSAAWAGGTSSTHRTTIQ